MKTNYCIYQINSGRDAERAMFLDLRSLQKFTGHANPDPAIYDMVYAGTARGDLEHIYAVLNINRPADYHARSLSVSDVIEVTSSDCVEPGFYIVDSVGFSPITFLR